MQKPATRVRLPQPPGLDESHPGSLTLDKGIAGGRLVLCTAPAPASRSPVISFLLTLSY